MNVLYENEIFIKQNKTQEKKNKLNSRRIFLSVYGLDQGNINELVFISLDTKCLYEKIQLDKQDTSLCRLCMPFLCLYLFILKKKILGKNYEISQ